MAVLGGKKEGRVLWRLAAKQFIVKAILNKKQIKHIKKSGKWPLYLAADVSDERPDTTYTDDYAGMDLDLGTGIEATAEDSIYSPSTTEKEV